MKNYHCFKSLVLKDILISGIADLPKGCGGKTSIHQESKLIEIGELKYIKEFDTFFHRQRK